MEMNPYQAKMLLDVIEQFGQPPEDTSPDDIDYLLQEDWIDKGQTLLTPDLVERIQTYRLTAKGKSKLWDPQDNPPG